MRTRLAWQAIRAVVIFGSIVSLACRNSDEAREAAEVEAGQQTEFADIKHACDAFTLDMARQFLGESAKQSESSAPFTGSTEDIAGSTCTYEAEDPTPRSQFATTITASIQLNGAKTDVGKGSHRVTFEQGKRDFQQAGAPTETVTGLGDAAYYIGDITNQLHVLVEGGKYVLIVSVMDPDDNNQGATERLARLVTERL